MEELTRLIREDMKPALGVTEPGAIAFAVASAKKHTSGNCAGIIPKIHGRSKCRLCVAFPCAWDYNDGSEARSGKINAGAWSALAGAGIACRIIQFTAWK